MSNADETGDGLPIECELCDEAFRTAAELAHRVWQYHDIDGDVPS